MSTRFLSARYIISFFIVISCASQARAWGERGHFIVGYVGARLFQSQPTAKEQKQLGNFFTSRTIMLGHVANIPDISWKDPRHPDVVKANDPCHYFDVEEALGEPPHNLNSYLEKIRNIEPNLAKFVKEYIGKQSPINSERKIKFATLGRAPFRTEQLFNGMVEAFKCADSKKPLDEQARREAALHYQDPLRHGYYKCSKKTSRLEDLAAAVELGGIMGHFVGDLSQPLHDTADYNGWGTGHGGVHAYFETWLLQYLDENLTADILRAARNPVRQREIMNELKLKKFTDVPIPTIMFHLIADSYSKRQEFLDADTRSAIIKPSSICQIGHKCPKGSEKAVRRDYRDPAVQAAFRPLIVERLTVSAYVLYNLWHMAWVEGGKPDVSDVNYYAMPYPLDVPFIKLTPLMQ